ncbi:hypothetical protein DL95DRAFT_396886 [Leptodontidium sp. 2 PMI_412]|nr:hypothetical protein DL95DRAFT_396886 [Leptodontidium sp. 2 PMI_412]
MASWLAYHAWRSLWRVFDSIRRYNFITGFLFDSSKTYRLISSSQPELPSTPSPAIQLLRLYPVFPTDGSKGDTTVDIIAVHGIETISPKT